jgi:glycosyltransferase involved in cell wall biosynthesis
LNILYYYGVDISGGGVGNVAYSLPQALRKKLNVTCLHGIKSTKGFPEDYFEIFNQFVKKEFDIIHFNTNPAWKNGSSLMMRFAKLRHTKTVLNIHGIYELARKAEQLRDSVSVSFNFWLPTLIYCNFADRIVVNSEYMRNNVVFWYRVNRDKVSVIPNGVDVQMFADNNERIMLEGDPSVLFVGHLSRLKGVDILIQAITKLRSELPNIRLHIVGGGSASHFEAQAKKEGVEKYVIFHGLAAHSILPAYYKSADICIFPSRHEGFGIVILEAMASGIPVIASDIPSFRETISNGIDGILFKSGDVDALTNEVVNLYQNPNLRKELSRNAIKKAKSYSWENIADKYIALYKSLFE